MKFATTLIAAVLSVQSATAINGCVYHVQVNNQHIGSICIKFGTAGAVGMDGSLYGDPFVNDLSNDYFKISLKGIFEETKCGKADLMGAWFKEGQMWTVPAECKDLRVKSTSGQINREDYVKSKFIPYKPKNI